MRSNGAVHIGNDTFLAATREDTSNLLLFSSAFSLDAQVASLPLDRRAQLNPHSALTCTSAELERYIAAARALKTEPKSPLPKGAGATSESGADAPTHLFRHALYPSANGHQVAAISTVLRHHYIIDIAVEPAAVCALEMPELVRSVCWHPVMPDVLYVLFVSGDMTVFDTSRSRIGVVLPRHRRVALRSVVLRCLAEAEEAAGRTSAHPASSSRTATANATATPATGAAPARPVASPSAYSASALDTATPVYSVHAVGSPTSGTVVTASHLAKSPATAVAERRAFDEVIAIDKEPGEVGTATASKVNNSVVAKAADGVSNAEQRPTAQTDLVDIFALPPTSSLPVVLLVLSSGGDVYAVHLSEADMLPVLATADAVDDGRVRTVAEERQRRAAAAAETSATAAVNAEVHYLIRGELPATSDEALAVRGALVDVAAGTHAVFYCTARGNVCGAWVSEPDLLARHRTAHLRTAGGANLSFTVRLGSCNSGGGGGGVRECLSPAVPSTTHTATMTVSNNLCLLRLGETGEATYLLALPIWDRQRRGWGVWRPTCEEPQTTEAMRRALPLLSLDVAVPAPVALRLPYDTRGMSVAIGETELVLVPEASARLPDTHGRRRILSITLLSLLRSALYARCGPLQLHPAAREVKPPVAAATARPGMTGALINATSSTSASNSRAAVLQLVNLIPPCHRAWLCAAPQADIDAATVDVVSHVERQEREVAQRERAQAQRRERLMARVALLEGRVSELTCSLDRWQQTLLDAIVHRRGEAAVRTANERLGEVYAMLNEWEQQQ